MSPSASALNDAVLALAGLQLDEVITSYRTNFMLLGDVGTIPEVTVTIPASDELSIERTKRRVQRTLEPRIKGVQITVVSGTLAGGGEWDRFDFERR